eukprot:364500-Chlamydomonas_euryale.AAC.17
MNTSARAWFGTIVPCMHPKAHYHACTCIAPSSIDNVASCDNLHGTLLSQMCKAVCDTRSIQCAPSQHAHCRRSQGLPSSDPGEQPPRPHKCLPACIKYSFISLPPYNPYLLACATCVQCRLQSRDLGAATQNESVVSVRLSFAGRQRLGGAHNSPATARRS